MEKKVLINGNEYPMKSSVLTIANYKNIFGMDKDFGEDYANLRLAMQGLQDLYKNDEKDKAIKSYTYLGKINELSSRIAYVLIKEADKYFMPYEEFASQLPSATKDCKWIGEVVGIASYVF